MALWMELNHQLYVSIIELFNIFKTKIKHGLYHNNGFYIFNACGHTKLYANLCFCYTYLIYNPYKTVLDWGRCRQLLEYSD